MVKTLNDDRLPKVLGLSLIINYRLLTFSLKGPYKYLKILGFNEDCMRVTRCNNNDFYSMRIVRRL